MKDDAVVEFVAVVSAILLAFLAATSDRETQRQLAELLIIVAWAGIAAGLSWMAIQVKRWMVTAWSELLNGAAIEMK